MNGPSLAIGPQAGPVVVTGGAGFIGSNLVAHLARLGYGIRILDNLSRPGVDRNARWLQQTCGSRIELRIGDVRDPSEVASAVREAAAVFHLAAQVAVTTSLDDPLDDFAINVRGTLNVLEAARAQAHKPMVILTSTNKVYGALEDLDLILDRNGYRPAAAEVARAGIGEDRPLSFHSPYGCSKGAADQYALDYTRSFGVPTVVLRMSCIYGPRQYGTEDQGWLAHFLLQALRGEPITIFGDGNQVRDVLFVDDLVDALVRPLRDRRALAGRAFNMGGGVGNVISLNQLLDRIARLTGRRPTVERAPWRTGDQRYYVSDTHAFSAATGWRATIGIDAGIERLHRWISDCVAAHPGSGSTDSGNGQAAAGDERPGLPVAAEGMAVLEHGESIETDGTAAAVACAQPIDRQPPGRTTAGSR
jgi:CDP-paratose 2-epimerase